MREFSRTDRIAEKLKQELAQLIQWEVKDPRLGRVTVVDARVSRDVAYADVYVILPEQSSAAEIKQNMQVLKKAAGFLRTKMAQRMQLRHMPVLRFHYDERFAQGNALSKLIDEAVARDRQNQSQSHDDGNEA